MIVLDLKKQDVREFVDGGPDSGGISPTVRLERLEDVTGQHAE